MNKIIKSKNALCTGCNRCVRECPVEMANITYQDEDGNIKVKIDHEKCITCGRCLFACKHDARYYDDDTLRFINDLSNGVPISIIAAPAIRANVPDYKKIFTYLKRLGAKKIYDVSLGADICIWAHIRHLEKTGFKPLITQPCPVIVNYCEIYQHDLLESLSPVHSPMSCVSVYMKEYEGITDKIAALSPCVAKSNEFEETGLAQYNVTFVKLRKYLEENNIELPEEETGFDHIESGIGSLFPMPGGLKENIEFYLGKKLSIDTAEGYSVFSNLDTYAKSPSDILPQLFDVLSCDYGCNMGTACTHSINLFEINRAMDKSRIMATDNRKREYFESVFKSFDNKLDISRFMREYNIISTYFPKITDQDISSSLELMSKTDYEKQNINCGACGSETCLDMARKIALNVNIPSNCIFKASEDAKKEHEEKLVAHEQIAIMEKTRETDKLLRVVLNANPHINLLFNSNFEIIDCNSAAMEFMNFDTKEEMIKGFFDKLEKSIPKIQSDGRVSTSLAERLMAAAKEGFVKFETEAYLDNRIRNISVEFKKIPYEPNFAIVAYVVDMTDIREREIQLMQAREINEVQLAKINMAVKATKIALWDMEIVKNDPVNPDNIFNWSDEFRHMLGFSDESDFPNVLHSWSDLLHPDDKEKTLDAFAKHMIDTTGKIPYDLEYRLSKKNGDFAYFHASGETIRDENGNPIRVAGTLMDITETKNILLDSERQRIEAEAANKAKSAFLSTMSHEIRTPMNAILGITEIQLQNDLLDQKLREAFDKIYVSGDLLLSIINDILDLSKIESGKMELVMVNYEIASLISDIAQLNMMRIGSKPIEFELHVDENLPVVLTGDELRVKQILNNLLSNAFKYSAEGTVKLSVTADLGACSEEVTLILSVSDTGQGMSKEQVAKLFEEYSRFNLEANRSTEGTGLGMSITRNLILMMNGEILIESEPGKGSTFIVRLPQGRVGSDLLGNEMVENLHQFRTKSRAQMKRVQVVREYMPYGSVLIVDDVETNIYVATGLMLPYGLNIDHAESGFAAIDKIKDGNVYDVVFMDHMMPQMDGIETTKNLRGMGYSKPIVALTANAVAGQADIFLGNGFDDFISKPIDVRQLNNVLNKLIRDRQPPEVIEAARQEADKLKEHSQSNKPSPTLDPHLAEIFVRDALKSIAVLDSIMEKEGSYSEDDLRTYVINVHGIKSALANIGNMDLSAIALKLEKMGRLAKKDIIASETPAFLNSLRTFVEKLTPGEKNGGDQTVDENKAELHEKLLAIKAACEEYDEQTADTILMELRKETWSQPTKELLNTISEHLLHSDFDEIVEAIEKFINQ